jgi:redox-sensitive bicupin YhaK (pirin superfamily)
MDRKDFIRNGLMGLAGFALGKKKQEASTADDPIEKNLVGFNHLPIIQKKQMNFIIHKASSRGQANHGWLQSRHSFSFASYYDPERMNFGVLRVLNDDIVEPGMGFGTHPHDNMEIISIPLEGDLEHKDSMGNVAVIREGDIQVMSAGKGIRHSEYNKNQDRPVKFLQIWIYPHTRNVEPRYDQIRIGGPSNAFNQILSPDPNDDGVWIHQDAWFHLGYFTQATSQSYVLKKQNNGVYVFIVEGDARVAGQTLQQRDAIGLWDIRDLEIVPSPGASILLMEVPMKVS